MAGNMPSWQNLRAARQTSCVAPRPRKIVKHSNKNAHSIYMYGGDSDAAISKATAVVTYVQSQSQEVGSGD